MAGVIACLSLYPFHFRIPPHQIGPLATLVLSLYRRPGLRDFVLNIAFYLPFGFFFRRGLRPRFHLADPLLLTGLAGGLFSLSMELAQYYDVGRVTSAADICANTLGTIIGAMMAQAIGRARV